MYFQQIVVILLCLTPSRGMRSIPQYAQDFSEHCRRRDALPSVFLSRRVMEADAQVLHFSRLDMPYSCFATVRTEAGNGIIMVVEMSRNDLQEEFCNYGYQLGVFEYAETFGGYWGPIPDAVLKQDPSDPVYTKQYTLPSKPPPVITSTIKRTFGTSPPTSTSSRATASTQGYITIDIPLVNLSASLEAFPQRQKPFDLDEYFDDFYDVLPRPGEPYKTSILPLVQIAIKEQDGSRAGGGEPRYELDYAVGPFTPDHRLTTPTWSTNVNTNRNRNRWKMKKVQDKRVHPKTNNSLHARGPANSRKLYAYSYRDDFRKQYSLPTSHRASYEHILSQAITEQTGDDKDTEPYNLIDNIMNSLNETGVLNTPEQSTISDVLAIFNKTEDSYRNLSVYLEPFPTYAFLPVSDSPVNFKNSKSEMYLQGTTESTGTSNRSQHLLENTSKRSLKTTKKIQNLDHSNNTLEVESNTKKDIIIPISENQTAKSISFAGAETTSSLIETSTTPSVETYVPENQEIHSASVGATQPLTDDGLIPVITTERSLSGTLVDHESWENVVQSAPVMAGLLNQHGSDTSDLSTGSTSYLKPGGDIHPNRKSDIQKKRRSRRKRHISAIMVDDARPHHLATTSMPILRTSVFNAIDLHEFARLIELPDDQMNNHVTIKLNPETNTQLFNMCSESNGTKTRFLIAFNSSRIILSISNFIMPHVIVTLTTARPLALLEQQCPESMVECQVEGTRLCIDSTNACNGIANCGSAYAYDEDRVLCGVINKQRSVYLAAGTCLAVLVTLLYITHYWLRRCVPNVAEAFFVYSDSADNELYLDSIMRSPMDMDGDPYMYNSALFDEENLLYPRDPRKSTNILKRLFSTVLPKFSRFKQQESASKLLEMQIGRSVSIELPRNSFTESDLRSMMSAVRDQEIQTGESLEMAYLKMKNSLKHDESDERPIKRRLPSVHSIVLRDFLKTEISDTSSDSPGPSGGSAGFTSRPGLEEKEIQSTLYDPGTSKTPESEKNKSSGSGTTRGKKSLRFNEHATFIPRDEEESVERMEMVQLSIGKRSHKKNDDHNTEHGGSDFRKFFRKKKDHK